MGWKINDCCGTGKGYIRITDERGGTVADIFPFGAAGGIGYDAAMANARTIASAPQMADALRGLLDWVEEGCPEGGGYAVTEAKAALATLRVQGPRE